MLRRKAATIMLELHHLCKTFNKGTINEKPALQDLELYLAPGDFVTVIWRPFCL